MGGDFQVAWDALQPLVIAGVSIGVIIAILAGSIRLGWKFAPYIIAVAVAIWFFGGA